MIKFVNLIGLYGNSFLQFKINNEFYIYKFYCNETAGKINYMAKFSAGKALNQTKKKANSWWKQEKEWTGWEPERKMDVGLDLGKHKPVTWEQLECKLST